MHISETDRDGLLIVQRALADPQVHVDNATLARTLLEIVGRIAPANGQNTVSLDEVVRVDLTERGREIHLNSGGHAIADDEPLATPLWDLMRRFGPGIAPGAPAPFSGDIRLSSHPDSSASIVARFRSSLEVAKTAIDQNQDERR